MKESLADQLGKYFKKPPESKKSRSTTSGVLEDLYDLLAKSVEAQSLQNETDFIRLAISCGRNRLKVKSRSDEQSFVGAAIDLMWKGHLDYSLADQLLATAALCSTAELKIKLRSQLRALNGDEDFDVSALPAELSRTQINFILGAADAGLLVEEDILRRKREKIHKKAVERQMERQRIETNRFRSEISSLFKELNVCARSSSVSGIELDTLDLRLVEEWRGSLGTDNLTIDNFFEGQIDSYKTCRLLSARVAEKAAINFLKSLEPYVTDVSIGQVTGEDSGWLKYDLATPERCIDVKNARRSFSSPDSFSEQLVKSWKKTHSSEVVILGTLSDYVTEQQFRNTEFGEVLILGEVSRSEILRLEHWVNSEFSDHISVDFKGDHTFLPGWIFDYPVSYYLSNPDGFESKAATFLSHVTSASMDAEGRSPAIDRKQLVPRWLLSFVDDERIVKPFLKSTDELEIWQVVRRLKRNKGWSRPAVYLMLMASVLSKSGGSSNENLPKLWGEFLFASEVNGRSFPLGIHDPMQQIFALKECLEQIWHRGRGLLSEFSSFMLVGPNILRGKTKAGDWRTIIAFCGGWKKDPVVRCGKNPIHIAESQSCTTCGKLRCSACGHCDQSCPSNISRRNGNRSPSFTNFPNSTQLHAKVGH